MVAIMFHSAGLDSHPWRSPYISVPLSTIALQLKTIAESDYKTVFLDQAYAARNSKNRICLTFDDGYLDNWIHIFPLLQIVPTICYS